MTDEPLEPSDAPPSASERKRVAQHAQELGERLLALDDEALAKVPISESVREAILEARRITSREALRRQKQLVGKLMRAVDLDAVGEALRQLEMADTRAARRGELLARWRARLLEQGEAALDELLQAYPHAERQRLRQLVRQARKQAPLGPTSRAHRLLTRALDEILGL